MGKPHRMLAVNTYYPAYLAVWFLSLGGALYFLLQTGTTSWLLWMVAGIASLLLCFDAVYYVFSEEEIVFVRLWGIPRRLTWHQINAVYRHRYGRGDRKEWPRYAVRYNRSRKGKVLLLFADLPPTRKIKRCLQTYYSGEILWDNEPKSKKKRKQRTR